MEEICSYHVEVCGPLDEGAFNVTSPVALAVLRTDHGATLSSVCTDQSGLIGLLRHLHRQGFVLLSVSRRSRA